MNEFTLYPNSMQTDRMEYLIKEKQLGLQEDLENEKQRILSRIDTEIYRGGSSYGHRDIEKTTPDKERGRLLTAHRNPYKDVNLFRDSQTLRPIENVDIRV